MYSAITQAGTRSMSAAVMFALLAGPFMALMPLTAEAVTLPTCTVVSDSDVQEGGTDSFELVAPYQHSEWTASIPGASWIWGDAMVATPTVDETQTFTATFDLTNAPTGAVLDVAADNSYTVTVGSLSSGDASENNFKPETQDTYTGITGLVAGTNTLTFTVTNKGVPSATATDNPAGLLFKLTVTGANCGAPTAAPVISYPVNGATLPAVASVDWNDIADPESPVTYQYQSSLSPATNPDGSFVTPAYTSGSLATSEIPTPGTPYGTYYVHAKAIDNNGNQSPWGPTSSFTVANVPVTPTSETVVITGNTTAVENTPGEWWFNRDPRTSTAFAFLAGNAAIGIGSLSVAPITNTNYSAWPANNPNWDKFVGEYFMQTPIADVESISYDFKIAAPADTVEEQFYLNVYATFGSSSATKFYDCRYNVVPTVGSTTGYTTVTFDPSVTTYSVAQHGSSPFPCPASPAGMDALSPGSKIRAIALNVGDTSASDTGVAGYLDRVVEHITNATTDHTTTYDFEPFVEEVETSSVTVCKVAKTHPVNTPLSGWNVYLEGEQVTESSILVPTNTSAGVTTGSILLPGASYLAKSFGTWTNQGGVNQVDTEYSSTDGFATQMDGYTGYSTDILELQINETFDPNSNWGPYNSLHEYAQSFIASSTSANFRIFDGTGITQNESWFGDNSGNLEVDLYTGFSGITGENGCVTFEDVPLGNYIIGETPQDGWEDVTEEHDVVVTEDAEDNVFYLVNENEEFGNESCEIVSTMTTLEGGTWTYEHEGPFHPSWTAVVDAMSFWIWGDEEVDDPTAEETQTFTKTFWLESLPAVDATLTIAADNSYMVELNGTWSSSDGDEDNYTNAGKDVITVPAEDFVLGANTLVFTVTNFALGGGTQETNPAGLNYKLAIPGAECSEEPLPQDTVQVHIYKYILDENEDIALATAGDSSFPMVATWDANNIGAGSGNYSLNSGNGFTASTAEMTENADYTTAEVTDGSVVVPEESNSCPAGKYRLVGYKTGDTLIEAENDAINDDAPVFTSLDNDKYVIVVNEDCDELDTPPTAQVKVHIYKALVAGKEGILLIEDGSEIDPFDMVSTWKADNLNGAATTSGAYVLGNYHGGAEYQFAADTSPMDVGANYTTSEVTGENGIVPIGGQCTEGAYRLVGYKVGTDYLDARNSETLYTEAPFLANLQTDMTIIVINEDCDDVDENEDPTPQFQTIVVKPSALNGWDILNYDDIDSSDDSSTTTSGTQGSFVFGPTGQPAGQGSFKQVVGSDGDDADRIRTADYNGELLEDLTQIEYSTYVDQNVGGQATYLQIRIDWDNDGDQDDRLFFEPVYQTGTYGVEAGVGSIPDQCTGIVNCVDLDTWQTWDVDAGGFWTDNTSTSPGGPPLITIERYLELHPGSRLVTDSPAIRVQVGGGAGAWDNFIGNADKLVIRLDDGTVDMTTTYDFEPEESIAESSGGGGGGGGGNNRSSNNGQVLGDSTDSCDALLTTYLSQGGANSSDEVTKLQGFLNENLGVTLPLTGTFGSQTDAAVRQFQVKYWEDVLQPWFGIPGSGITSKDTPTGYVYKTTKWKINDLYCPGSEALPEIP